METRSFVMGALAGVAAFAVVDWLIAPPSSSSPQRTASVELPAEPEAIASKFAASSAERSAIALRALPEPKLREVATSPFKASKEALRADFEARRAAAVTPRRVSEQELAAAHKVLREHRLQEQADLAAEGKDVAWSYQMEQLLTHYIAGHPAAAHFDISSIDCRTTYCEIRATSAERDVNLAWGQIVEDLTKQPWAQFYERGTSAHYGTAPLTSWTLTLARRDR